MESIKMDSQLSTILHFLSKMKSKAIISNNNLLLIFLKIFKLPLPHFIKQSNKQFNKVMKDFGLRTNTLFIHFKLNNNETTQKHS